MKKTLYFLICTALMITALCSCNFPFIGGGGNSSQKNYTIVYSNALKNDLGTQYVTTRLTDAIKEMGGSAPTSKSDSVQKADGVCEIIIGDTTRALSAEAKAAIPEGTPTDIHAFSVIVKDGDVAIYAKSLNAMKLATEWFVKNHLNNIPEQLSAVMFTTHGEYNKNGVDATCHSIETLDSVSTIDAVTFDGKTYEAFDPSVTEYNINLSIRDKIPTVVVKASSIVTVNVTQAKEDVAFAIVEATAKDGKTKTEYTFNFIRKDLEAVEAKIEKVYGGRDAIVVIVHDDGTEATAKYMASQFKMHGLVGTIGLMGKKIADKASDGTWRLNAKNVATWQNILNTGVFDIANHSLTHSFFGVSNLDEEGWYLDASGNLHQYSFKAGKITEEVTLCQQLLRQAFPGQDVLAFIKPGFGRVSDANGTTGMTQISDTAYDIISSTHIGMRDTGGKINNIPVDNIMRISSYVIKGEQTANDWQKEVIDAQNKNGMLVFLFHTITAAPAPNSLSGTEAETDVFFEWLGEQAKRGDVWNTFLEDAIMYVEEYKNAKLETVDYGHKIDVTLTDTLTNTLYNHPLTVTVPIHSSVEKVTAVFADGSETELEIMSNAGEKFVRVNIVPDSGTVSLMTE